MKKLVLILAVTMILAFSVNAMALITPNETTVDLNVYNAINTLLGTVYGSNAAVDFLQTSPDALWHDFSTVDMPGGYIAIGVSAGNLNTLRVYDVTDEGTKIEVLSDIGDLDEFFGATFGTGTFADPYKIAAESVFSSGENFGWSLLSEDGSDYVWDSDPSKNSDGLDHMLSYHLGALAGNTIYLCGDDCSDPESYTFVDPFLIAWEDLPNLGDGDYNDMLYLVDRVAPIPEPISMLLFGSGLFGLMGLRRKQG